MNQMERRPEDGCPAYERGLWSLEEEPACCDTCRYYDEPVCKRDAAEEA